MKLDPQPQWTAEPKFGHVPTRCCWIAPIPGGWETRAAPSENHEPVKIDGEWHWQQKRRTA